MQISGHQKFGAAVCDRFDAPDELIEWAVVPDMGFWFTNPYKKKIFHRWTLHGLENVDKAIEMGKKRGIEYSEEYSELIETILISHSYLDMFNGPLGPYSYPNYLGLKIIPQQALYYPIVALSDPDGIGEVFLGMMGSVESLDELRSLMVDGLESPFSDHRWMTKAIMDAYRGEL